MPNASLIWKNLDQIPNMSEQKRPFAMLADLLLRDFVSTSDRLIAEMNQMALNDWDRRFSEKYGTLIASQKLSFTSDDCATWYC